LLLILMQRAMVIMPLAIAIFHAMMLALI